MVIKPSEFESPTAREEREFKKIEKNIDLLLRSSELGHDGICISAPINLHPGTRLYKRFIDAYTVAGWNVKYEYDQRNGDFLSFTPRRKRK